MKFGTEEGKKEWTTPPHAKFHPHQCNMLPLWGKPRNCRLSNLNTSALCCVQCCRWKGSYSCLYTVYGKMCHYAVAADFANCCPIFKILSPTDITINFCKSNNQIPHHNSNALLLPCEMFGLKNHNHPKLSQANFHARLPFKTVAQKYSSSDVSIILFTDKKIFTATMLKNLQNDRLYADLSTKKKDVWQNICAHN